MWRATTQPTEYEAATAYLLHRQDEAMTYRAVIDGWKQSGEFRDFFAGLLRDHPGAGYFWEVKPITVDGVDSELFEFVLYTGDSLPRLTANPRPFREWFTEADEVVAFPNLRGDARLVVPTPRCESTNYAHLASFLREVPTGQVDQLWRVVGVEYERAIGAEPKWLSTAGMGVHWLHVRIDTRPKYYRYRPYR